MYAKVLVELKAKQINQTFTYHIPSNLKALVGMRVFVPFGHQQLEGFVLEITQSVAKKYDFKDIISLIDEEPVFNEELIKLGNFISQKTLSNLIYCYQTMVPRALKANKDKKIAKKYETYLNLSIPYEQAINECKNELQKEIVNKTSKPFLKKEANKISSSAVKTLIKKGILQEKMEEEYRLKYQTLEQTKPKELHPFQQLAYQKISQALKTFKPFLLHGVTGSGKTEVYLQLIAKVIENQQALILVPEISLTPQFVNQFVKRFGNQIAVLHSGLSDGEKYDEWRRIKKNEVKIVIGARSAIFAPLENIGIIIIDEEHSKSYKQENNPKYNTIDIALWRGKYHNCPVVLGSATPSLESYTRAKLGVYELLEMKTRISKNMPHVSLVDMRNEYKKGNNVLSDILVDKINDRLAKKEQVMLLLNRRGYTTITICRDCGYVHKCPACDISYTYHQETGNYTCHYCDRTTKPLFECPECHSKNLDSKGMGTEKLQQYLEEKFKIPILRMDVDTTRRKGSHEKIIEDFQKQKYQILLGTQMIAKGLDFPNVTLVGVLNGDTILNIPDFRSAERTFQLLNQVAGRAGRSNKPGEVIIQGFAIDHYSIVCAANHDYQTFYEKELSLRKRLKYSPYYNICLLKISGKDEQECDGEANKVVEYLKEKSPKEVIILGPSLPTIPKINNTFSRQIIIKYKKKEEIYRQLEFLKEQYQKKKVSLDVDFNQ